MVNKQYAMLRNVVVGWALVCVLMVSCRQSAKSPDATPAEDKEAKGLLQGIWVDEESESVAFKVEGDSVFYPDDTSMPTSFKIVGDTLIMGNPPSRYPIQKQTANSFWFTNQAGDVIRLAKSTDPNTALAFVHEKLKVISLTEVLKKDTVVMYGGERYHCYIAINPTKYKVIRKTYNDDGVEVDNVYYDQIIHVSVYHGAEQLYSRDFKKSMFAHLVPERFLSQAVLSNIDYSSVGSDGFHFDATLCIPDAASCYLLDAVISFDGEMRMEVIDY